MWTAPDLIEFESLKLKLRKPKDLTVLSCPAKPDRETGPEYFKKLDTEASNKERQDNFRAAGYLYGLLFHFGTDLYAHGSVNTLYAETKLSYSLYRSNKPGTADRVAKDTLVLAKKIRDRGHKSPLATYCVKATLDIIRSLAKKYFNQSKYEHAKKGFEYGLETAQALLTGDKELIKDFKSCVKQCNERIQGLSVEDAKTPPNSALDAASSSTDKYKKQPDSDSQSRSPSRPKSPGVGSESTPQGSTPNNDSKSTVGGSSHLNIPTNISFKHVRSRSIGDRSKNKKNDPEMIKDVEDSKKRSKSVSVENGHIGHCFDSKDDTGMAVSVAEWAKDISPLDGETTNCLKRTQKFLENERGGYQKGIEFVTRRIRVAVLDTGFDASQLRKKQKQKQIKTFCTIPGMEKEGDKDEDGHGTNIVRLILDVAAEVDVYSWRVFKSTKDVTSAWVEPAIRAAIAAEVDIITLSFGFDNRQQEMHSALREAMAKEILVFAAASNFGGHPDIPIAWPARIHGVFCIFATDDDGNTYEHNPTADELPVRFATFGENIRSSRNIPDNTTALSGTSYATPIAAATAALFLDFSRICMMGTTPNPISHCDVVHYYDSMEALLKESSQVRGGLTYIKPWSLFKFHNWHRDRIAFRIDDILRKVHGLHVVPKQNQQKPSESES